MFWKCVPLLRGKMFWECEAFVEGGNVLGPCYLYSREKCNWKILYFHKGTI